MEKWDELNAKAVALYQQGWYSEAASLAQETVSLAEELFGPDHANMAESLTNLALIYYAQGLDSEKTIFQQTLIESETETLAADSAAATQSLNKLLLFNLARKKYALAESLLKRALKIKKKIVGPKHHDVQRILGHIAELYNSQGKYAGAESFLQSIRSRNARGSSASQRAVALEKRPGVGQSSLSRGDIRHEGNFPAIIFKAGVALPLRGITEDISQSGAFIKTSDFLALKEKDQVSVSIFLPSFLSEKHHTVGMKGTGYITRVDKQNEGIAIKFQTSFEKFERIGEIEVPKGIIYNKLVNYLSDAEHMELTQFLEKHPKCFFAEKFEITLDPNVIYQRETQQLDRTEIHNEFEKEAIHTDSLEVKVIEINKSKIDHNHGAITVGRSAHNDVVLYNKLVSKSHAFLFFLTFEKAPYLVDLGSTNGTFLNDEKMALYEMYPLADGDDVSFGRQNRLTYLSARAFYDLLISIKQSCTNEMN